MPQHDAFLRFATASTRGGVYPMEWDDLCSGRGVEAAYRWCSLSATSASTSTGASTSTSTTEPPLTTAGDIAAAWRSNPTAEAALLLHYDFVMRFAANLCVVVQVC
jgi:hypothetical protein